MSKMALSHQQGAFNSCFFTRLFQKDHLGSFNVKIHHPPSWCRSGWYWNLLKGICPVIYLILGGALKKRLAFSNLQSITVHPWGLKMEFLKIGFRCLSSNDCPKGSVFAKGEMCLLLWSQKIHFFQLLGDFWESKGSARSSNLPSSLKLSSDGDLKVLIASNSSEKSKAFFLGQFCNLSGIFFLGQRSTVREIENLKKWIRPKPGCF